jgi:hypothetical protein
MTGWAHETAGHDALEQAGMVDGLMWEKTQKDKPLRDGSQHCEGGEADVESIEFPRAMNSGGGTITLLKA